MRLLCSFALLGGCLSDHERLLYGWEGVYAIDAYRADLDGCDAPLEATPDGPFVQLVTEAGTQADLVDLRWCEDADECERVGFLTFVAPVATSTRLEGARDELYFTAGLDAGVCQVVHEAVVVSRSGPDAPEIAVEIRSGSASDQDLPSEDACFELLSALASDPEGCQAFRAFEARRDR